MADSGTPSAPQRQLITTRAEYLDGLGQLLARTQRQLRIFDPDLSELDFNSPARIAALRRVLAAGRTHRIYIALHDVEFVSKRCPRLIDLLLIFPEGLHIYRTEGEAARAQDRFVLVDENDVLRRPVAQQSRGVLLFDDPTEAHGMRLRFEEIWESSVPGVSGTTSGL